MGWMDRLPKVETEKNLGTVTFREDYCGRFSAGQTVNVSKAMLSPGGIAYYKIFGTTTWVNTNQVKDVNVTIISQRKTYQSVL